ncbi:MAG: peptidase prolyl oligopeptidase active site domain protein [Armatimonadetes bacterium]|jgi:acylaminoacyl-peptidase|nr:peptidase prolyl oligopeptidase active site domain protein [Armatimonadota bacterium]
MPSTHSSGSGRLITAADLFRIQLVSDPQLSPNGERVVYSQQWADVEKNKYFSNLWVVDTRGGEPRRFTHGDQRDGSARWSPDGTQIAFLSDRGEQSQIWCIAADGGEARALTTLEEGTVGELYWSPDGTRIAFNYRPKPAWARKSAREEREKAHRSTPPLVIRRLHYREEGGGYVGDERWHLFMLDLATGEHQQLTTGDYDHGHAAWSPDGTRLAFITNRSADPDLTLQLDEIRVIPAAGGEEALIPAPAGPKHHLTWSPDGASFAYYGHADVRDVWSATDPHLWVLPATGGEGRDFCADLDRPAGDCTLADLRAFGGGWTGPVWGPDSRSVYFLVCDRGATHVYEAFLDGELLNRSPGFLGEIASLSIDRAGHRLAAVVGDPVHPGDVHLAALDLAPLDLLPLTAVNQALLAELELAVPQEVTAATDGGEVHGWLLHPPGRPAGEPAPLILYVHGGPHTQYGWAMVHELQLLAARGFAVLFTNPRGSRGYGQAHVAAIAGDWGGADYRDLMAAVDHAVTLPGIDPERVGVTGGSYGGYMTNWMLGHTDRFRCGVTQRSVVNLHSMGGTCDFTFSGSSYFGGNTWDQPQRFLAQSPLSYAGEIKTPLLIIHSEGDLRCPIEQAEQLFAALKCRGQEVEFIRYPREANHGLSRSGPPDLRTDRLERIVGWMERWLRPAGNI